LNVAQRSGIETNSASDLAKTASTLAFRIAILCVFGNAPWTSLIEPTTQTAWRNGCDRERWHMGS